MYNMYQEEERDSSMIEDLLWYGCLVVAVLVAGVAKGGFGGGGAFLSTLILALVMVPSQAVAVMLLIFVMMDQVNMVVYWGKWNFRATWTLMWSCVIGVALGWWVFDFVDEAVIKILMALTIVMFFMSFLLESLGGSSWVKRLVMKKSGGVICGVVGGFTSCIANAGGPPITMYFLGRGLSKTAFQGSTVLFFWWVNLVKLPAFVSLGLFPWENIKLSLMMIPIALLGLILGYSWHKKISELWYKRLIYVLLVGVFIKLSYDGLSGLGLWV
jgi:uncharacterized membrane protein YfcA